MIDVKCKMMIKQPKLGFFQVLINKKIYFTQINAQQHFAYLIFQQNRILSNQELLTHFVKIINYNYFQYLKMILRTI